MLVFRGVIFFHLAGNFLGETSRGNVAFWGRFPYEHPLEMEADSEGIVAKSRRFPIPRKKTAKSDCWLQPLLPGPRFVERSPKKRGNTKKDRRTKQFLKNGLGTYIPILYHMRDRHFLKVLVHLN